MHMAAYIKRIQRQTLQEHEASVVEAALLRLLIAAAIVATG